MPDISLSDSVDPDRLAPEAGDPAVSALMRDEVVFCLPSTPADAIAKLMADNQLAELPVLIDRRPVGYVTASDVLHRLATGELAVTGSDFAVRPPVTEVQARHLLRTPPLRVDERQRFSEVVEVMAVQGRTVALVMHEDETAVGMVTPIEVGGYAAGRAAPARPANAPARAGAGPGRG